jgi:hypothetical protein
MEKKTFIVVSQYEDPVLIQVSSNVIEFWDWLKENYPDDCIRDLSFIIVTEEEIKNF